jgi:hypothetical protein
MCVLDDAQEDGVLNVCIHAKVIPAERVTDDVPASKLMMQKGFAAYLVTLDVKSFPLSNNVPDREAQRSAARRRDTRERAVWGR